MFLILGETISIYILCLCDIQTVIAISEVCFFWPIGVSWKNLSSLRYQTCQIFHTLAFSQAVWLSTVADLKALYCLTFRFSMRMNSLCFQLHPSSSWLNGPSKGPSPGQLPIMECRSILDISSSLTR
jgi:hypothetical protein